MTAIIPFPIGGFHRRCRAGVLSLDNTLSLTMSELAWDQMVRAHSAYRRNPTPETLANRKRAAGVFVKYCRKETTDGQPHAPA